MDCFLILSLIVFLNIYDDLDSNEYNVDILDIPKRYGL